MTNLLVQSVDTIHFYHFLSTEHNCVQITPSQGNSHKILLSIKINAMFYFWENEEEIGKAVQEKKNLGRTLFFGQSFGYSDTVMMKQLFTQTWHLPVLLICFPPIPLNPNPSVLSQWCQLWVMSSVPTAGVAETLRRAILRAQGCSGSGAVRLRWQGGLQLDQPDCLCCGISGVMFPKNLNTAPWGHGSCGLSASLSQAGPSLPVEDTKLFCALLLQKIIAPQAFVSQAKCKLSCRNMSHFSRLSKARTSIFNKAVGNIQLAPF